MGDAASQHYQEAAMAGVPPGRGMPVPGMLPLCQGGPAAAHSLWPGAGLADGANSPLQEPALLAQLVQLLGQRPRHSLLLSDLGALLPTPLRHGVKEKGGLRAWLQKYPELFQVCGSPGKESVTLLLGSSAERVAANSNVLAMKPTGKIPQTELPQTKELATPKEGQGRKDDEDEENEAAVQMRGLPYRATVADVKKFLGDHAETLKDDCAIQLVANRDGRPSGFARVQFDSPAAARAARDKLHMQTMEVASGSPGSTGGTGSGAQDRYVEVFLYSERPNKLRIKKIAGGSSTAITEEEAVEASKVSKEQVVAACREHMLSPGKAQLLLSMLGVALSDAARLYLKKTDQGLKQFLAQYPHEFTVDGVKGREYVSYLPAMAKAALAAGTGISPAVQPRGATDPSAAAGDMPSLFSEGQKKSRRAEQGTGGPATGSISDLQRFHRREDPNFMPQSPKVTEKSSADTPKQLATPSDWGTPQPATFLQGHEAGPGRQQQQQQLLLQQQQQLPKAGIDLSAATREMDAAFPMAGMAPNLPVPGQSLEDWAAWAIPPPNVWADPSCWQEANPWGAMDFSTMQSLPNPAMLAGLGAFAATGPAVAPAQAQAAQQQPMQEASPPAVHLKGLPFNATEQDVLAFFAKHDVVDRVSEAPNAVKIVKKSNGKSTGQAIVHMMSRTDAHVSLRVLNGQYMDSRYIEVSHYSEASKGQAQGQGAGLVPGSGQGQPSQTNKALGSFATETDVALNPIPNAAAPTPNFGLPLPPLGVLPSALCPPGTRTGEGQGLFDGASDTGGSGGTAHVAGAGAGAAGLAPPFPQMMWWGGAVPDPSTAMAKLQSSPPPKTDQDVAEAIALPAGEGGAAADDDTERWEALYNFLKLDGEAPAAAIEDTQSCPEVPKEPEAEAVEGPVAAV